ncbi:MAG: LuxR C-terminal-related transcriptional regulator [Chloroflexota bacterium]
MTNLQFSVLIVDNDNERRAHIRNLIDATDELRCIGDASHGRQAAALAQQLNPDVVVITLLPSLEDNTHARGLIRHAAESASVLLIGDSSDLALASLSVTGEPLRRIDAYAVDTHLILSLRALVLHSPRSSQHISRRVLTRVVQAQSSTPLPHLTPRQLAVLRQAARGLTNRDIGSLLNISQATVDKHLADSYVKLSVSSRDEAIKCARQLGWLDDEPAG